MKQTHAAPRKLVPRAYSYLRFSSPQQSSGDSRRRQTTLAEKYADTHGLQLDHALSFRDLGVSAYRSKNARTGALRAFLEAVESHIVPPGSYLLVESLDRLSRDQIVSAQALFLQIIQAGIVLVTLADGRSYSEARINENPYELIISLVTMMRANEESATKSLRNRAAWEGKRARAHHQPMTNICPGWLELHPKTGKFCILVDKADVVRRIYRDFIAGKSQLAITQSLNREQVPLFGTRQRPGRHWHRAYVGHLLTWPAVVGRFVPHITRHHDGKLELEPLEPIDNYYPSVISQAAFEEVQALRRSRHAEIKAAKGPVRAPSIFAYLAKCPLCGASMTRTCSQEPNWRYLTCATALVGGECVRRSVRYPELEHALLAKIDDLLSSCPKPCMSESAARSRQTGIAQSLRELSAERRTLVTNLDDLRQTRQESTGRLGRIEAAIAQLSRERRRLQQGQREFEDPSLSIALSRLRSTAKSAPLDHAQLNSLLRKLLHAILIHYDEYELEFVWRHGGRSFLQYNPTAFMKRPSYRRSRAPAAGLDTKSSQ